MSGKPEQAALVFLSSKKYLAASLLVAVAVYALGFLVTYPTWLLTVEVAVTVLALFVFGSMKYRIDKNALTYGAALVIVATFFHVAPNQHSSVYAGLQELAAWAKTDLLSLQKLEKLIHADTLLFIFGLTFFVNAVTQTRLLETVGLAVLRRSKGNVARTIGLLGALVAFLSGILDGVSMIGLLIRVYLIVLLLAKADDDQLIYVVMLSTAITTVCGMWLAYGEPPNLIMKANLYPVLNDAFFLRHCLPAAVGSYFIVLFNLHRRLRRYHIKLSAIDIFEEQAADVRFLQTEKYGELLSPLEIVEEHRATLAATTDAVRALLHQGSPLGPALLQAGVDRAERLHILGRYLSPELAQPADRYYSAEGEERNEHLAEIKEILKERGTKRRRAQKAALLSFIPFVLLLVWHASDHSVPLFCSSAAGFICALAAIIPYRRMTKSALGEAMHESREYLFLVPLFLSISLLQRAGTFDELGALLRSGTEAFGRLPLALGQFVGCTVLSALLDNNVVADFAGRALQGLDIAAVYLYALAQIAGYAVGGCLTHIGSAQSIIAFSIIIRQIKPEFTPWMWVRSMAGLVGELALWMLVIITIQAWFLS